MSFGIRHSQQNADHLHWQFGDNVNQKVDDSPGHHPRPVAGAHRPQIILNTTDHPWCQPEAHESPNLRMPRVVHHVEHLARDRQVL
ncbi:hypothetical protein ABFA25_00140 [Mycobacterium lepromatosis]|nr:hypothetical protein [Mycobacterium lepromatosis]